MRVETLAQICDKEIIKGINMKKESYKKNQGLSKELFENYIDELAKEGKAFSNEQQFQFEFAQLLHSEGFNVLFEVLTETEITNEQKVYTDLVAIKDKWVYPIELKYKTPQLKEKKICFKPKKVTNSVIIFSQGANDLGRYDYLRDVQRLEQICKKDHCKGHIELLERHEFEDYTIRGFAVILVLDKADKDGKKCASDYRREHKNTLSSNFSLHEGRNIDNTNLFWHVTLDDGRKIEARNDNVKEYADKTNQHSRKLRSIHLCGKYSIEWKKYQVEGQFVDKSGKPNDNYQFHYLCLKINP